MTGRIDETRHLIDPALRALAADDLYPPQDADLFTVAARDSAMPMVFVDTSGADPTVAYANAAFATLTGFGGAGLVGQPLDYLFDQVMDRRTKPAIERALKAGGNGIWEMQCRRADWTEFSAAITVDTLRDGQQRVTGHSLSFVKLTGRAERLLDPTNEFHVLYENAPGFIAITEGPEHRFAFANATFRTMVGEADVVGLTVSQLLGEALGQDFLDLIDKVYLTGEPQVAKAFKVASVNPASGANEYRYLDFVQQPVYGADGGIRGLFCEGHDVTEQHTSAVTLAALQAELIHVSRVNAMNAMSTTLAHELNQPLSAIANYVAGSLRIIDAEARGDARIERALHGVREASERAADIIRNLHDLTKRRDPVRTVFDVEPAIDECIRLVSAAVPAGVSIVRDVAPGLTMKANRVQIQQVVINLLRNASEAGAAVSGHVISVVARASGEDVIVQVIDAGRGVSPEAAAKMFSWSQSSKENGMGLGLSICRTIIEAHRGQIWLERTGSDGSEFCFSVPRLASRRS